MNNDLFRLIYCSRNAIQSDGPSAQLEEILAVSRRNNRREEVTGALLYSGGIFAQVLEGPFTSVQRTFERIQADDRHDEVVVLQLDPVPARMFGDWAMALAEATDQSGTEAVLANVLIDPKSDGPQNVLKLLDRLVRREKEHLVEKA